MQNVVDPLNAFARFEGYFPLSTMKALESLIVPKEQTKIIYLIHESQ